MSSPGRARKQYRRFRTNQATYLRAIRKHVKQSRKKDSGYLYIDTDFDPFAPDYRIWAHEFNFPQLIHKGRKP